MNLEELFRQVEDLDFVCHMNLASGFQVFLMLAQNSETVKALLSTISEDQDPQSQKTTEERKNKILSRIAELAQIPVKASIENRWDIPLSIYTWVLSRVSIETARNAAEVCGRAANCRWAKRMKEYLDEITRAHSSTTSTTSVSSTDFRFYHQESIFYRHASAA